MTEGASEALTAKPDMELCELFTVMHREAAAALEKTPDMLPQLKQAGVVDSGGSGFLDVIQGMLSCVEGNPVTANAQEPEKKAASDSADFSNFNTDSIKFAYCTECIVTKNEKYVGEGTADALHQFIMKLGDSVVFVDDAEIIKLHVHTNKPGKVLTEALRYGSLYTVKMCIRDRYKAACAQRRRNCNRSGYYYGFFDFSFILHLSYSPAGCCCRQ